MNHTLSPCTRVAAHARGGERENHSSATGAAIVLKSARRTTCAAKGRDSAGIPWAVSLIFARESRCRDAGGWIRNRRAISRWV